MFYTIARFILSLLFKICFRIKVFGRENFLPEDRPVIVAPNHVSFLDPMIVGVSAPRKLNYLARNTLFRFRLFAKILYMVRVSPIKRQTGDINAFKLALNRLSQGDALLIFPEGTRSEDGKLQSPKSGIGFLQVASGVSILPCYIKGSMEAWPRHSALPRFNPVSVYFGRPLRFDEKFPGSKKEQYMHVAREVIRAINQLREDSERA
ncbi:MAG TPA: 1-acyl-sn-glycerol-3-phosphate acyltransferase [Nitrospirae bacterium]|nr:1-acyl-sn-glycerol-3-phosphate acyltransferase [Nitrospirota bacterium]